MEVNGGDESGGSTGPLFLLLMTIAAGLRRRR
jgi:MYXO-CTERM domain-containing protein